MSFEYEYVINEGTNSEHKVSANSYGFGDGFFHFFDPNKTKVFSIRTDKVVMIQRTDAQK